MFISGKCLVELANNINEIENLNGLYELLNINYEPNQIKVIAIDGIKCI